jgi:alkylation response protein AidB-like acyl-CoA dehydrogenase
MSAFVVERGMPGLTTAEIHGKMGLRAGSTGSFACMDVRVPVENRLGEEGEGFAIAMSCLDQGRYGVASGALGLIRACLDSSVSYANTRTAFGVPIGQHQLVKAMIADMVASRDTVELLCMKVGWLKNQGSPNSRETALAKWVASEASQRATYNAVQIHGSYGYSSEYPVERFFRNARVSTIYEGSSQIQQLIQADYALGGRQAKSPRCTLPPYVRDND